MGKENWKENVSKKGINEDRNKGSKKYEKRGKYD